MLEYLPWSVATLKKSLNKYCAGIFSSLDIELGGECNYHCVYCDSPDRKKTCAIHLEGLDALLSEGSFDWVYICGLGEPTHNGNYERFIELLRYCRKRGVKCSVFSNLSNLTPELQEYIKDGILHLQFKYDSNDFTIGRTLYGTERIREQLNNITKAKQLAIAQNDTTNLAASIVPTRLNKDFILPIIEECLSAQIYPLLGELEPSGKGEVNYENLCLNKEELMGIKEGVEKLTGGSYEIPICPSVISGIHFSYDSFITVDKFSGLSCHWFWLAEPHVQNLMRFSTTFSLHEIEQAILSYRDTRLADMESFLAKKDNIGLVFGGCGGNVQRILRLYFEYHRRCTQ
jgi:hypothetical protein